MSALRCLAIVLACATTGCPSRTPEDDADAPAMRDADEGRGDASEVTPLDAPISPDACPPPTVLCGVGCVDVEADPDHCGACLRACVPRAGSIAFCQSYRCIDAVCRPGFGNCDGDRSNGCEVDVDTSVEHCGRCGRACPAAPHALATCERGVCALACEPGHLDCDSATPGCECEG